ncbi:DUF5723 family protein [Tenacibaculum sp. SG-28]|uniref:DUF5723 family protein n=1 Tax=Tenacibaculum sp. SG-28 TaxID=754426 RepID=UPI000CF3B7F8|nr:DUF5723 family protein [Tenacibaculum sp. SG-28]PQJ22981.1 hypothetical protein BSU00_01515 [Tenacibaculum sp. SG-28]
MKKLVLITLILLCYYPIIFSQNKQVLFGFDEIPQTLLLNPGSPVTYKYHIGIPMLSGISVQAGITGFTMADLFNMDNIDFTTKFNTVLAQIDSEDYVSSHAQIEILNGGYKLNSKDYLSGGFYLEMDIFSTYPKDVLTLFNEGNSAYLNTSFSLAQPSVKGDGVGVLHFGLTRNWNPRLTAGARLKVYSGVLNVTSSYNSGSFTTRLGNDNLYTHYLNNLNVRGYSSGIFYEEDTDVVATLMRNIFLGGNLGLGFDIGLTYNINTKTQLAASILDVGFISYTRNIKNASISGNYSIAGIELQYDGTNPDYWSAIEDEFRESIPSEENENSYSVARPIKFNASISHNWGRSRKNDNCHDTSYNSYYDNAIGGHVFTVIRPTGPKFAITGFYEKRLLEVLKARVTYTVDDFSYSNIGLGLSAKMGIVNVYGIFDNLLHISDIAAANATALQVGVNLIFK